MHWARRHLRGARSPSRAGDREGAERCFEESLTIAREGRDSFRIAAALQNLATVAWDDPERRRALTREALELFRKIDAHDGVGDCLYNLGRSCLLEGRLDEARDLLSQALPVYRIFEDRGKTAMGSAELGACLGRLGDPRGGRELLAEALRLLGKDTSPLWILNTIESLGCFAIGIGESERALRYLSAERAAMPAAGVTFTPEERRFFDAQVESAREALRQATGSEEAADRAEAEGRALTLEAALADAAAWLRELEAGEAT